MRKLITLTLAVLLVGLFAAVVFAAVEAGDDSTSSTVGTTETTETTDTTETTTTPDRAEDRRAPQPGVDISGPCDEAEHANDPRLPLWPLAHAAVELLTEGPLDLLKVCSGCRWLFLDQSKNRSRRWCSMEVCGTSAKKRRYVERRRRARA
jgi:CGNR zinc finger